MDWTRRVARWVWAWLPEIAEAYFLFLVGLLWWMVTAQLPLSFAWLTLALPAWVVGPVMAHLRIVLWLLGAER